MRFKRLAGQLVLALFALLGTGLAARPALATLPPCTAPAGQLTGAPGLKSSTGAKVQAAGGNAAHCSVALLYGTNASENINIVIALPFSAADGGSQKRQTYSMRGRN
jgi:hypothetical protein